MKLNELKTILATHRDKVIHFVLPTGTQIPCHAHVTDVARIDKNFIDCGGKIRTESHCRLQVWYSDDTEHRIGVNMLHKVLEKAAPFLESEDLEVDVEYEAPFISQFPLDSAEIVDGNLVITLGTRHTTCLAKDVCVPKPSSRFELVPSLSAPSKCC